jgi:hypothetical protein
VRSKVLPLLEGKYVLSSYSDIDGFDNIYTTDDRPIYKSESGPDRYLFHLVRREGPPNHSVIGLGHLSAWLEHRGIMEVDSQNDVMMVTAEW